MADDETRARATLVEMQGRISRGPNTALGVALEASPEQVRAAFLELTKQFHPARFGRMSTELQRLSNEVFLGIKSAHESMMRALGAPLRGLGSGTPRTNITAEGSTRTATPVPRGTQPSARGTQPQTPAAARTLTPPFGVRLGTPPTTRPGTPPTTRPGTPPTTRPGTPPTTRPGTPPRPTPDADTIRGAAPAQPRTRTGQVFDEDAERRRALDLVTAKNWAAARMALEALVARVPPHLRGTARSKEYRALVCVMRGQEARASGRDSDAHNEFQRALEIDPELAQAKSALDELLRRR